MASRPKRFSPRGVPARLARDADQRRGSARARGYDRDWEKAARAHRAEFPLCQYCEVGVFGDRRVAAADLVDHLYPHKGDRVLFWQTGWWVSCCTACHSGPKQALERRGRAALDALAHRLGRPPRP